MSEEIKLSAEEIEAARKVAREEVVKDAKTRLKDALIAKTKLEERAKLNPAEALREITLDLAPHQQSIMLDGVVYFHGATYTVSTKVYETMAEVQARGWDHEDSISDKSKNTGTYRRKHNPVLTPNNVGASANQLLRA